MRVDRIRSAMREQDNMSQSELARRVGVTQGTIQQLLAGKSQTSKYLPDIARELHVSVHWLSGRSEDPRVGPFGDMDIQAVQEQVGITRIREVDIGYAMGDGSFIDDNPETTWANFDSRWLSRITRSSPDKLFVAQGIGDSMMPTLLDADTLIVDRGRQRIDQQDRIWAVAYGELGMIKRIRRLPSGRFLVISDNPAVADFEAEGDEIYVIGRVCWVGRTT